MPARDENALLVRIGEKNRERGLEFRSRVVLAARRVIERAIVEQAVQAGAEEVRLVVQQLAPLGPLGELELARALDELRQVGGVLRRRGRAGDQQGKKNPA